MSEKLTIEATIPYAQYGNVKPTIEVEGEEFDTIRDIALGRLRDISNMVAPDGARIEVSGLGVPTTMTMHKLKAIKSELTGVSLMYDATTHTYTNGIGTKYMSGSKFPDKFYAPLDSEMILKKMANKFPGLDTLAVEDMWSNNNKSSTGYGTAIHTALENYDRYQVLGKTIAADDSPNRALSKNVFIKKLVQDFHEKFGGDDVMAEPFIADDNGHCGQVDRIKFIDRDKKIIRIQDYKTDGDIYEKKYQVKDSPFKTVIENNLIGLHRLQLSFYAYILQQYGYVVEGIDLFWANPNKLILGENPWEIISSEVVDISKVV